MSAKKRDWVVSLHSLIERRRSMPFKWGIHDCCQFARAAVEAQTGADPAVALALRTYRTRSAARAQLRRLGGLESLPARCGLTETDPRRAGRGAIVMHDFRGQPALGVCLGIESAFPSRRGLVFVPTLDCRRAWRID